MFTEGLSRSGSSGSNCSSLDNSALVSENDENANRESHIVLPLDVLSLPFKKEAVHKQRKNLRLVACHLSGNSIESNNFRSKLQMLCVPPGEEPPNFNMKYILRSGLISVVEGRLIPCNIMK